VPGDRFVRPLLRRVLRGRPRPGGLEKVFRNLCLGLDRLEVPYLVNLPFNKLRGDDLVGVLGLGRESLRDYKQANPIVAGIGLMTHPGEWPSLCDDYPIAFYLQHSEWTNQIYAPYFKEKCRIWPVGIDTESWRPSNADEKVIDFLIYEKILWDRERKTADLLSPIRHELTKRKLTFMDIRYGVYGERAYKEALKKCRAMIFLSEHESQGLAYQECLASGVPVIAWDQGWWLDPIRFAFAHSNIPASSVPYFDDRCGLRFERMDDFADTLTKFMDLDRSKRFSPRSYVIEKLTLEKCSRHFVEILAAAVQS
jgi:glycosyltransferase involved in cell wall biosynthesis